MTTQISTQTISFNNQYLITFEQNGKYYTAMKPICENIALDWKAQHRRISNDEVLRTVMVMMTTTGNDGKNYQMLCLPIEYLNGWLFGVDVKRVKPEIRDTLIKYKKECYQALHDYWFKGKAERKTTTDERTGLRQAVSALVSKKGLIYSDAYSMIHQRFNVEHIDELTAEQIPLAVEYVHKIYLEGELIIDPEPTDLPKTVHWSWQNIHTMSWMWFSHGKLIELLEDLLPALEAIKSSYSAKAYSHVHEYRRLYKGAKPLIEQLLEGCEMDKTNSHNLNVVLRKLQELNAPPPPVRRLAHRF